MKWFKYISTLMMLLAVTLNVTAQKSYVIDSVCVGAERYYRVDGEAEATYAWMLTDTTGATITLPDQGTSFGTIDGDGNPATTAEIKITWNNLGRFTLWSVQTSRFGCDTIVQGDIKVFDHPDIYAGNDQNVCPGSSVSLDEAYGSNYSTVYWTTNGDGTFDDPTLLHPVYTPGANDLLADVITVTITAQGIGNGATCTPAVDSLDLYIIHLSAELDSLNISCYGSEDGSIIISGASGGSGNYTFKIDSVGWSSGWTSATTFDNLGPGIYTVQMRDSIDLSCEALVGNIEVLEPEPLTAQVDSTDATCLGDDGTITVSSPQGGSGSFGTPGTYEYRLNTNAWQTSGDFTDLVPGDYEVWIRNAFDPYCETIIDTIVIKLPAPLLATASKTDVTCFGDYNGTISITNPQNGSGDYEFSINNSGWIRFTSDPLTFNGLPAGDYSIQMRDFNQQACVTTVDTVTIEEPKKLAADISKEDISCYGAEDGQIAFSNATGGSETGYNFSIDGGISWHPDSTFTDLSAGIYPLSIQDQAVPSCTEYLGDITVFEPPPLTAQIDFSQITCYQANDGRIILSNPQNYQGGSYQYQISILSGAYISGWTSNSTFANLGPGFFQIEMRDANGCYQVLDTVEIIEPDPLTANVSSTNTTCLSNDGTITISDPLNSVSGTYGYRISGGNWVTDPDPSSPYTFYNLPPDTFVVEIRDAALISCEQVIDTVIITAPDPLYAETEKTDVSCFGGSNGTITAVNAEGGSGVFEFSLEGVTNWQLDSLFTGLVKGDYVVLMRDAVSPECLYTIGTVTINEPDQLVASTIATTVSCYGGNDGTISVQNPQGGSGGYEFSLDGTDWITSTNFDSLYAGQYLVQMRDSADHYCMVTLPEVIVDEPAQITATLSPVDVSCYGGSDGQIIISGKMNGTPPYEYSNDGGTTWQTDSIIDGLSAGTYTLMIRDALGCETDLPSVDINQPDPLDFTATATNETAENANDGTILILNQTGGSGNYEYSLDGSFWQATTLFTGLAPGTYTVWMSDVNADDCMVTHQVIILPAGAVTAEFDFTDVTCYGGSDGSITFTDMTGATKYEFSVDGGASWHTSSVFSNLTAGSYSLVVRDADNTFNTSPLGSVVIDQPLQLNATITQTNETFPGASDGSFTIHSPTGGSGAYEFNLNNGSWGTSTVFTGIGAGTYTIGIRDANVPDCMYTIQRTIPVPGSLYADVTAIGPLCFGETGSITFSNETGGSGVYEYSIDNGQSWQKIISPATNMVYTNLVPQLYFAWIRDANQPNNKVSLGRILVPYVTKVEIVATITSEPRCNGGSGTVTITGGGGTPPYIGDFGKSTLLKAGETRTFTVTDQNNCTASVPVTMPNPDPIVADTIVSPPLCYGDDGIVTILASGGTGDLYANGIKLSANGTKDFPVPGGSNFSFIVTDSNGCVSNVINGTMPLSPPELVAKITPVGALCYGDSTGSALVKVTGGTAPFTIQWDDPMNQTDSIATNLVSGTYTATITDANNCIASDIITVVEPTKLLVSITGSTNVQCVDDQTGTATAEATGGTPGYTYLWDDSLAQTTPTATGLGKGTYTVIVTDQNNCTETATVTINAYDDTPPQAFCNSIEIGLDANGHYTLTSVDIETIANGSSDNCTSFADLDLDFYPMTFDCSTVGKIITGTLTVTDLTGNSDTCTATIVVNDTIPPQLTCQDIDLYLNSYGQGHLTVDDVLLAVSDPCGIDTIFIRTTDYTCYDVGVNSGIITAIDVNGNQTICDYNVTVIDTTPPEVSCQNLELTLDETGTVTVTADMMLASEPSDECGIESIVPAQVSYDCTDIGSNTVKVTVTDVNGNIATCDANVTINAFNLPPVAQVDQGTTVQNNDVTIAVLTNDSDPNSNMDVTSLTIANPPAHGTANVNSDYTITYTPDSMYVGPDQFVYQVCDDGMPCGALCDTAQVDVTVLPPNSAPTTSPDFFTGGCISIFGSLTMNDIDINGDQLVINTTPAIPPSQGTVTIYTDGTFRYDFDPGISYQDSFVYEVCDDNYYTMCSHETVYLNIFADSDCDGVPNSVDIDDDNDGIIDTVEGDGTIDTDGDGIPNSLDIDADGDGIIDNIEGQAENGYIPPSGVDDNNNGLDDIYEQGNQLGIYAVDTDNDGIPDYLDPDSDNDGVPDYIEGYDIGAKGIAELDPTYSDIDGDGLDDAYDNFFGGFNEGNLENPYGTDPQLQDFDDDGIRDWRDTDDDNDLIPTKYEDLNNDGLYWDDDIDMDGHPEYLDFQGECDLFIPEGFSPNGDGIHDFFQIFCIDKYPNAKLLIFDRWGDKMYEHDHYGNLDYWGSYEKAWWDGTHTNDGNGEKLRIGNYLYILIKGDGNMERGFVMLSY